MKPVRTSRTQILCRTRYKCERHPGRERARLLQLRRRRRYPMRRESILVLSCPICLRRRHRSLLLFSDAASCAPSSTNVDERCGWKGAPVREGGGSSENDDDADAQDDRPFAGRFVVGISFSACVRAADWIGGRTRTAVKTHLCRSGRNREARRVAPGLYRPGRGARKGCQQIRRRVAQPAGHLG